MKTYTEYIAAGVPLTLTVGGSVLYVQRSEAGQVLDIDFIKGNASQGVQRVGKGFKAQPAGGFDTVRIKASASGTVEFVVTDGDLNVQFDDANTIIGNDDGQAVPIRAKAGERIPVDIAGGTVQVTADNVGVNNGNPNAIPVQRQALGTLANLAPVVVNNNAAVQIAGADPARRKLVIRNGHATAEIGLGAQGVTLAMAAIHLLPGDTWEESDAAGAQWFAISDTVNTNVQVMGVSL